ncbi:anthranilate phosphoribosyltransferase [Malassezia sp. CBS 17886]|nr:anthranilate phosphoribosyltransferase [Malassezia sp. CBS 17886]
MSHSSTAFRRLHAKLVMSMAVPPPLTGTLQAPGPVLTDDEVYAILGHFTDVAFTSDAANSAALGSTLVALRLSGLDRRADVLSFLRQRFLALVHPLALPEVPRCAASDYAGFVDIVGTGGDGKDTFNVSTTASLVAAGVPGMHVCKHGSRASSSTSGSAELLIALGVPLTKVPPAAVAGVLAKVPCTFLLASQFHKAMAPLAPIRASLGVPTLFNILGPLMNPACPARGVFGVHSSGIGELYADALRLAGCEYVWVVCGREGLDEISPAGPTDVWELRNDQVTHRVVAPADFGLPTHRLEDVRCGTSTQNASVVVKLFTSGEPPADAPLRAPLTVAGDCPQASLEPIPAGTNLGALFDYTLIQAAAALCVGGFGGGDLKKCTELARASLLGGGAHATLQALRDAMNEAAEQ